MQPRRQHLALGHEAALHHVGEHHVGARARRRKIDVRRVFRGCLEQPGEHRGLGQVQVLDRLAEVEVGSCRDAERAAAHIGAVEIELQDLLLGQVAFQPDGEEGFLDLALDGALVGQEQVLGELLGEARTALDHRVGAQILAHGAHQAEEVDAVMLEESAVLGRQHGLDEMIGHIVNRHGFALDDAALADLVALAVEEGDGEIVLGAPVGGGLLEGRQCQRQHYDGADDAERETFARQLEKSAPPAVEAEAAREDGERFPDLAGLEARLIEGRIDPRIDREKPCGLRTRAFADFVRAYHSAMRPVRGLLSKVTIQAAVLRRKMQAP